ncbi:MAG: hypothetical protein VX447_19410 [Pseudomonadota bacterium]|uniref:hypothetical protein n=1 Tax=Gallaecimonas pentaromativorans TaxID=584787 RepID=UPI00067E86E6|nr:hypothetical protein [Gallaecimonas pentaromativorans]MED5526902.1 hypothetical protein [Pseudomonadota bacterium]
MYFYVEPEVSGGFGDNTVVDTSTHPPLVSKLHYQFDGWLGDDLLETFPCYVVSALLAKEIELAGLTGYTLGDLETSKSEQFKELYSGKELPTFYWLKIDGVAGKDDFGIAEDYRLTVSEKALKTLKKGKIDEAEIENF